MHVSVSKRRGREYATAATSHRKGGSTTVEHKYLGRVVDLERGIFYNKEEGYFTFDVATGKTGSSPEDFSERPPADGRRAKRGTLSFGDAFPAGRPLCKSGLWDVVDVIPWANKDTPRAMAASCVCPGMANCRAEEWF